MYMYIYICMYVCMHVYVCMYVCIYISHNFFIRSSVNGHIGCFHVLAIINNTAVNTGVPASISIMVFSGYMSSSGIAGSCSSVIPSFLRNLYTVLHSDCITLHSHQNARWFPFGHSLSSIYCL